MTFRSNVSSEPKYDRSSSCDLKDLKESHFKISHSRDQWTKYCKAVFDEVNKDTVNSITFESDQKVPLLVKVRNHMSHSKVVYTTVDELYSGNEDDVGTFLAKLKQDLCIGQAGYPTYVVGGDQQIYAKMKNLKVSRSL